MLSIFKKKIWPPRKQNPPWGNASSIYTHIALHIDPEKPTGLSEEGYILPDEPARDPSRILFAPGAIDGIMRHHGFVGSQDQLVAELYAALKHATENASERNISTLYSLIKDETALSVIDALIEKILLEGSLDARRLYEIAYWFATQAADREPVKFSIAMLGVFQGHDDPEIFLTLGRHDEFTLYAAVAIAANGSYGDEVLWRLAKASEGWGRINTVERLASTTDRQVKQWLIREGYKNDVMYEYLACICARAGDLHLALDADRIDDELFDSAVEIVETLLAGDGGPAEGFNDYEHGCVTVSALLEHGAGRFVSVSHYSFLLKLKGRLDAHQSGEEKLEHDWSDDAVDRIVAKLAGLLANSDWKAVIFKALETGNRRQFLEASRACQQFGADPWQYFYNRTAFGEEYWWDLMRITEADRIDQVLELGLKRIPLDEISTGPSAELGLGPGYLAHGSLDCILQDLGKFPGKGWAFVAAGLFSPVLRNRHMAIRALSDWGRNNWPEEAMATLSLLQEAETDDDIRMNLQKILEGQALQ